MIKRLLLLMLILLPVLTFSLGSVNAANPFDEVCTGVPITDDPSTPENEASSVCAEKDNDTNPLSGTGGLLLRAARFLSLITGIASIIIIIYGSIKYMTSTGTPASVDSAKNTIFYALIGLIISLFAQAILVFVINNIN